MYLTSCPRVPQVLPTCTSSPSRVYLKSFPNVPQVLSMCTSSPSKMYLKSFPRVPKVLPKCTSSPAHAYLNSCLNVPQVLPTCTSSPAHVYSWQKRLSLVRVETTYPGSQAYRACRYCFPGSSTFTTLSIHLLVLVLNKKAVVHLQPELEVHGPFKGLDSSCVVAKTTIIINQ